MYILYTHAYELRGKIYTIFITLLNVYQQYISGETSLKFGKIFTLLQSRISHWLSLFLIGKWSK